MVSESERIHQDKRIAHALVIGNRTREMLRELPSNIKYDFSKIAGISIPANKKNSPQALSAAEIRILEKFKKIRFKPLLDEWKDNTSFETQEIFITNEWDWKMSLWCFLEMNSLEELDIPENYQKKLLEVIEGKEKNISGRLLDNIRRWMTGVLLLDIENRIRVSGLDFSILLLKQMKSFFHEKNDALKMENDDDREWLHGYNTYIKLSSEYEKYTKFIKDIAKKISNVTPVMNEETLHVFTLPEDDKELMRFIHSTDFCKKIREQAELLTFSKDTDPYRELAEKLIALPLRLQNIPLEKDRKELSDEAAILEEALNSVEDFTVEEKAPILYALGKVMFEGASLDDSIRDIIGVLSSKFVSAIENGVITLSELTLENSESDRDDIGTEHDAHAQQQEMMKTASAVTRKITESSKESHIVDANVFNLKSNEFEEGLVFFSDQNKTDNNNLNAVKHNVMHEFDDVTTQSDISEDHGLLDIKEQNSDGVQFEGREKEDILREANGTTINILSANANAQMIASSMVEQGTFNNAKMQEALQIELLIESEYDWFYLLSSALGNETSCSPWVAEVVHLGTQYQPGFIRSEMRLKELFEHLEDVNTAWVMALLAGVIRPCLMIPHVYPQNVVSLAVSKLDFLPSSATFGKTLIDYANRGTPLADEYIRGLSTVSSWEEEKNRQIEWLKSWLDEAPRRKMKFQPATRVWANLSGPNGQLARLVKQSLDESKVEQNRKSLQLWKDPSRFERILAEATEATLGDRRNMNIRYGARDTFLRRTHETLDEVAKLLDMHERSRELGNEHIDFIRKSFSRLQEHARIFREAIEGCTMPEESPAHRAGAKVLDQSLQELINGFTSIDKKKGSIDPVIKREQLGFRIPSLSDSGAHIPQGQEATRNLIEWLASPINDVDAFFKHLNIGNIDAAEAILKDIIRERPEQRDELQAALLEKSNEWKRQAAISIESLLDNIQGAYLKGVLGEQDQNKLSDRCERLRRQLQNERIKAIEVIKGVKDIRSAIEEKTTEKQDSLKLEVERVLQLAKNKGIEVPSRIHERIRQGLEENSFTMVLVSLELIEKTILEGSPLSDILPHEKSHFDYHSHFKGCSGLLSGLASNFQQLINDMRSGNIPVLPEMDALDETDLRQRIDALEWWNTILNGRTYDWIKQKSKVNIFKMLRWLGFQVERRERLQILKDHGPPNHWKHYEFSGTIDSPLPLFGSLSRGKQQLVFVWGRLEPSQIAQWLIANITDRNTAVTIFCFNPLTFEERSRAMMVCRVEGVSPLIIDSTLIAWLCAFPSHKRTKALFHVAMAGSNENPYTPMGGSVPPEMFFGREADIHYLWRIDGPCIIYGGRQLGKSALLKEVHRRYNDPENMNFVFYEGVQPDSDLWKVFQRRLQQEGLLPARGVLKSETIRNSIKKILAENESTRILFLLDECDYLLEQDSKSDFNQIKRLRDLMNETDKRFKAVFTGLHNVQRFQKIPNQPLAHFGSPLRIGPLDAKDAIDLIESPLRVLGYTFDSTQLVHQVLAQTNYHPSLIQLFCHELVNSMVSAERNRESFPPFLIKETTISQVWRKTSLSQKMRDRFDWTLNLDKRYRAIGYTVALLEAISEETESGLPTQRLFEAVKESWPAGFMGISMDEFLGLLDEMEGLGVLARDDRRRFRLRNANVLQLMGGEEGILEELAEFGDLPPEDVINPQVMRRIINKQQGIASPLTLQQEGALLSESHGIHIIVGSEALGISSVQPALERLLTDKDHAPPICPPSSLSVSVPEHLIKWIKEMYRKQTNTDYINFFINLQDISSARLTDSINELSRWINHLRSEKKIARVILLIDVRSYVQIVRSKNIDPIKDNINVFMHYMLHWKTSGLEQWFHDMERPGTNSSDLIKKTGGWHIILQPLLTRFLSGNCDSPLDKIDKKIKLELIHASGIMTDPLMHQVFTALSDLGGEEVLEEDLVSLLKGDGLTEDQVRVTMKMLMDLCLVRESSKGVYAEPVLVSALRTSLSSFIIE
jgi:hypothetical protein